MGLQSSRMFFDGHDHKDIYFQGHYHKAMYIGNQLVWEKKKELEVKYWECIEYGDCSVMQYDDTIYLVFNPVSLHEHYINIKKYNPSNKKFEIYLNDYKTDYGEGFAYVAGAYDEGVLIVIGKRADNSIVVVYSKKSGFDAKKIRCFLTRSDGTIYSTTEAFGYFTKYNSNAESNYEVLDDIGFVSCKKTIREMISNNEVNLLTDVYCDICVDHKVPETWIRYSQFSSTKYGIVYASANEKKYSIRDAYNNIIYESNNLKYCIEVGASIYSFDDTWNMIQLINGEVHTLKKLPYINSICYDKNNKVYYGFGTLKSDGSIIYFSKDGRNFEEYCKSNSLKALSYIDTYVYQCKYLPGLGIFQPTKSGGYLLRME